MPDLLPEEVEHLPKVHYCASESCTVCNRGAIYVRLQRARLAQTKLADLIESFDGCEDDVVDVDMLLIDLESIQQTLRGPK